MKKLKRAGTGTVNNSRPANHIWSYYVGFPAAVLAGLVFGIDRGMEEGHIEPLSII